MKDVKKVIVWVIVLCLVLITATGCNGKKKKHLKHYQVRLIMSPCGMKENPKQKL